VGTLLHNAINQLIVLSELKKCYIGLNIEDIFIKDDKDILIIPSDKNIFSIQQTGINLSIPFEKSYFTCPEIMNAKSLPIKIEPQYLYFTIGQLCIFCMFNINILKANELMDNQLIENILLPIKNSNYYWCIKNSILKNGVKRELLFID
jgi:hypothetical protein